MTARTTGKGRGKARWLTADSLKAGEREQYAVQRSYGLVIIELFHDPHAAEDPDVLPMPWITRITIGNEVRTYSAFRLNAARKKFAELVRQHP